MESSGKGKAFGYFFGTKVLNESEVDMASLRPENAVLIRKFGELGLQKKEWPIIGVLEEFDGSEWPAPKTVYVDSISGQAYLRSYDDKLGLFTKEEEIDLDEAANYPDDGISGSGAIEARLTALMERDSRAT